MPNPNKAEEKSSIFSKKSESLDLINAEEEHSRVLLSNICIASRDISSVESQASKSQKSSKDSFTNYQKLLLNDDSPMVFFEAAQSIASSKFKMLLEKESTSGSVRHSRL